MVVLVILFFLLCTLWIPLLLAALIIKALDEGVVRTRSQDPNDTYGAYSREKDPVLFWMLIAMYGAVIVGVGYTYVKIAQLVFFST